MELLNALSGGEFSCIRVFKINEEAWFIGKDICKFFGDTNHKRTISRVDDCDKQYIEIEDSMGRKQNAIAVNESGMYSILFSMQPQKANNGGGTDAYPIEIQQRIEKLKRFKHWVTSEVLPTIRKTGGYQKQLSPAEMMRIQLGMIDDHENRIENLENNMTIDYGQQQVLGETVNHTVISILGGKESNAYKEVSKKVFAECNRDLKNYFQVNARNNVQKKRFEEALQYAKSWKPCTNTQLKIENANAQMNLPV